ncbi:MAG: MFS transporter [Chloroflexota bacterium]
MTARSESRQRAAVLVVVVLALFSDMLLYTMVVPILPLYASSLGASTTAISVLFVVYSVALLIVTPFVGGLSDRIGRRQPMLVGLVGLALATMLFAFATDYTQLVLARLLQGVAAAITWSAGLAMIADAFDSESRGWAMGVAMAGVSAGSLLGPPVGGLLYELGGYQLPFLVATALVLLDGVVRFILIEAPVARLPPQTSFQSLLGDPTARMIALVIVISAGGLGVLEPTLPLFLERELHTGAGTVGLLFAVATLTYTLTSPLSGRLVSRWGTLRPMTWGLVGLGAALMCIGYLPHISAQALLLAVMGIASGLAITPSLAGLAEVIDRGGDEAYGVAYALFNTAYAVGLVIGPLAGGVLTDALGFPRAMLIAGFFPLVLGLKYSLRP